MTSEIIYLGELRTLSTQMDVPLTIGKSYIVQLKAATRGETIRVLDDENMFKDFRVDRFVTQSEWLQRQRHNKLNELGI
jgi:hypothetical protein